MGMVSKVKDKALAVGLKYWINSELKRFGTVANFEIDSTKRTIRAELDLKGEQTSIILTVGCYTLQTRDGTTFIKIAGVKASREWITVLLNTLVEDKEFPIPDVARIAL